MKSYRCRPLYLVIFGLSGLLLFAQAGAEVATGGVLRIDRLLVGGLLLVFFAGHAAMPMLRLGEDGLDILRSPVFGYRHVKYRDIREISRPSPAKAFVVSQNGAKTVKIRLPLPLLAPAEREAAVDEIRARTSFG